MNKRINVAALQSLVAALADAVESVLTDAENGCLPLTPLTEALRDSAVGDHLDAAEDRAVEAAKRLGPVSPEEESRIRKDAAEDLVGAFVRLCSDLETAKRRGIGFAGERASKPVRAPGARVQKWVSNTRDQMLHGLIQAGFSRDQLVASKIASEREIDIALTNLTEAREKERAQREAIEAFVAAHKPVAKTG